MSRPYHCLSEVCNGASLTGLLMVLAAFRMPRTTMVLKLSPQTSHLPMRPFPTSYIIPVSVCLETENKNEKTDLK